MRQAWELKQYWQVSRPKILRVFPFTKTTDLNNVDGLKESLQNGESHLILSGCKKTYKRTVRQ
jgi:hypothetical protein